MISGSGFILVTGLTGRRIAIRANLIESVFVIEKMGNEEMHTRILYADSFADCKESPEEVKELVDKELQKMGFYSWMMSL